MSRLQTNKTVNTVARNGDWKKNELKKTGLTSINNV